MILNHQCRYSYIPYDLGLANQIERLMDQQGPLSFQIVQELFVTSCVRLDFPTFVSMVVNRDWAVTSEIVTVGRLAPEMSFTPLFTMDRA